MNNDNLIPDFSSSSQGQFHDNGDGKFDSCYHTKNSSCNTCYNENFVFHISHIGVPFWRMGIGVWVLSAWQNRLKAELRLLHDWQ